MRKRETRRGGKAFPAGGELNANFKTAKEEQDVLERRAPW